MQINVQDDGPVTVLSLEGDFVIGEPETVFNRTVSRLLEEGRANFVIDMENVRYVDSSGLGALVRALTSSQQEGGVAKLLHVGAKTRKLLEITQLTSVFELYDDLERAVASF